MKNAIGLLILGSMSILTGIKTARDKVIPQYKGQIAWDVSDKPYIAYVIGIIFIIYGVYTLKISLKTTKKIDIKKIKIKKIDIKNRVKNMMPDMNLFTIVLFILIAFPTLIFGFYFIIAMLEN
jgi:hypothetical protein